MASAAALLLTLLPMAARGAAVVPAALLDCGSMSPATSHGAGVAPWRAILDKDGVLTAHRITVGAQGKEVTLETGARGFSTSVGEHRVLIGERSQDGTLLVMVDADRACALWRRSVDQLMYGVSTLDDTTAVQMGAFDPLTRRFEGTLELDAETGATNAMIDGECASACEPNDGELFPAVYEPAAQAQPVPSFPAGGWPADKVLRFRWQRGNVPPDWAKQPIRNAAVDATESGLSRSPTFVYRSGATNSVRYTSRFPSFCRFGIACAWRSRPSWAVWIRPQGSDFSWGILRWCQKRNVNGCFDLRRVVLHELGHVTGLTHPSTAGFTLAPRETVMQAITPARPAAGSSRHAFARCDVATLQELYDVPRRRTRISSCNNVHTKLSLEADRTTLASGTSVQLRAVLRIANRAEYGLLRRNPLNGRSVKLKYRRAGSSDSWTTTWMKPLSAPGGYASTITPSDAWEFRAVFPSPDDEGLRFSRSDVIKVTVAA